MGRRLWGWMVLAALVAPRQAQDSSGVERLALRVSEAPPIGPAVVDRGTRDGVLDGDRVFFHPREGGVVPGIIATAGERTSTVELHDPGAVLPVGTKGEVLVPVARLEALRSERAAQVPEQRAVPEHLPWSNPDDEYRSDMPLLTEIPAVHPEERGRRISGRAYFIFDGIAASEDDRTDVFSRLGVGALGENLFGRGGELHIDAEINGRMTEVEDQIDLEDGRSRIDRASYLRGGTRYDNERFEFGRFLVHGMPEFGVTDGVEYARRLKNGDTIGGSLGYMPSPDREMESGDDFQLSAYYLWRADEREQLSIETGFQKTFHQARSDRDLFVTKLRYLPEDGWDLFGSFWVDFYDTRDLAKKNGPELTQAFLSTGRRWTSGNGVNLTYSHLRFPDLQRVEFLAPADLLNARNDRLALSGWRHLSEATRVRGLVGVWDDEDEDGGDVELSVEVDDWIGTDTRTGLTALATMGEFATIFGARATYDKTLDNGRWGLLYEANIQDQHGFQPNNDDLLTHWLRASRDYRTESGWDLAVYADARAWDEEGSFALGLYLQRRF